ncbi:chemerin-like receptor 1 [Hypomesus transpacificus]|uniref:chemerin-like receptor 1 n=1 Tax=Hypomesus transpacificus TaxID=137520 RepID=UPI001F078D8C|nr:chemerin-like receptor 1 [Hypomesus transpacificus]
MDFEYEPYGDYTAYNETNETFTASPMTFSYPKSFLMETLVTINIIICLVGLIGNGIVIWISGYKMKKTVNTTWHLSLAISDFLFCACLPFNIFYTATLHWPFGLAMCKLASSALFLNMFSSVFLLVLISVDRCVIIVFPIWSQNHRTVGKAVVAVVLMWVLSAALTVPSLVHRQIKTVGTATECHTDYGLSHSTVAVTRFVCGFLIPFLVILCCCSILFVKLRSLTLKSKKPFKVIAGLVLAFFVCWVPFHSFVLLELHLEIVTVEAIQTGLKLGGTLASANSFLNPILYVFIGNDFRRTLKRSVFWRIENAMAEDARTDARNPSKSMESLGKSIPFV